MKRNCVVIATFILVASLLFAPVEASVTNYFWDNIYFIEGTNIKYPHPDRDYYVISPYAGWIAVGTMLYHVQIDHDTSNIAPGAIIVACAIAGAVIGLRVGGTYGGLIGTAAGAVLGWIASSASVILQDEVGCIWFWVSISFVTWLTNNAYWLGPFLQDSALYPIALAAMETAFLLYGYLRLGSTTIYDAVGAGSPAPPSSGGGGGGCPYVYTWNGTRYVLDNNILPAAEMSNGADVQDYYKLEQPLVPTYQGRTYSQYSLQIREFEHEHDHIDQVKLLAVDHGSSVDVAVSPYGEILTYGNPAPAVSAVDDNGVDVLPQLSSVDENYYQGYNGSHVTLTFAPTDVSSGVKLVIREDSSPIGGPPYAKCPVYVQVLNATQDWNTVATFYTRTYWATDIINMEGYLPDPQGNLTVRLCFVSNNKIDYVGLDATPQASVETHEAHLISAFHSTQGNVKPLLMEDDQTYAELIPGEQIQLTFRLPNNQREERTFILYTEGHYSTIAP
jgi:hypothetical protein